MKRAPKKFRKAAKVLMDPEPKFVSIVKAGANMTPLLAIKRAGELQEDDMKITAKRSDDHDVAELRFDKAKFKDAAAVQKWLDAGGYSDYAIIEGDAQFSVKGVDGLSDVREVTSPEGVTMLVGKRDAEAQKAEAEPAAEAEAASAIVAKEDESEPVSKDEAVEEITAEVAEAAVKAAVQEVVKAAKKVRGQKEEKLEEAKAHETAAPAEPVVAEAAAEAEAVSEQPAEDSNIPVTEHAGKADEILAELRAKGLYEILDVGSVLYTMAYLVQDADYSGLPEEKVTEIKSAAQNMLDVMDWFMKNSLDTFSAVFKNSQKQEEIPAAETAAEKTEETAPAEAAEKAEAITEPNAELAALTEKVETLAKAVEMMTSAVSQKASGEDDGVKPARQTRKGADVSDAKPEPKQVSKEAQAFSDRMTRNLLGF